MAKRRWVEDRPEIRRSAAPARLLILMLALVLLAFIVWLFGFSGAVFGWHGAVGLPAAPAAAVPVRC